MFILRNSNLGVIFIYIFLNFLQRLRCKCNFRALKFVPKIQEAASLLVRRIRKHDSARSMLDKQLLGNYMPNIPSRHHEVARGSYRYLALHLRFEEDMVAYSQCDFGGGESERKELQSYREIHFPLLIERLKSSKYLIGFSSFNFHLLFSVHIIVC